VKWVRVHCRDLNPLGWLMGGKPVYRPQPKVAEFARSMMGDGAD